MVAAPGTALDFIHGLLHPPSDPFCLTLDPVHGPWMPSLFLPVENVSQHPMLTLMWKYSASRPLSTWHGQCPFHLTPPGLARNSQVDVFWV